MKKDNRTRKKPLLAIEDLRIRLEEAEETLSAIRRGEVDGLVVSGPGGDQVFTLKGAERSYRFFVEAMNEGAVTLSFDGTILYCNERFAEMVETPYQKIIGDSIYRFVSSPEAFESAFQKGKTDKSKTEGLLKRKDCDPVPASLSFNPMQEDEVPGVCMVVTDLTELARHRNHLEEMVKERTARLEVANVQLQAEVTERKRAEEERERLLGTIREEKDRLSTLINSIQDEVWFADTKKNFTLANPSALREFGLTGKTSKHVRELAESLEVYRPDGTPRPVEEAPPLRALQGEVVTNQEEMIRTSGTGELRFRQVSAAPVRDAWNRIIGSVSVVKDITERKQAEEMLKRSRDELEIRVQERTSELARANKELQEEMARREQAEQQLLQAQKLESIGTLTGGIAHDINNILGPIVINSEMALLDIPTESVVRKNLEMILESGLRGRDLVKQMLLFSRKSEKKQEVLPLTPLIKETFKLLRSSLPTTIQMKLLLETESDTVYADPSQIQQVVMNLCTNAAYAMRGKTGSIDISLQGITFGSHDLPEADMKAGDYVVLSVKDTGPGMDEEVRKRAFEPFFTTKPVGEGTGLGLAVVYGIVKSHKGNITVYSEPAKGSIFRVYLPKADTGVSEKAEPPKPIPRGKERILFVDDEEIIVNSVRNMLEHLGYKVTALMDSEEAMRLFSERPSEFDLVMTDQTMPFMTGEILGRELMRIRPDIPIILCTGYSDLISSEKAMAIGFREFIMKPFTLRESAELVRRVLDRNRSK